MTLDTGHSLRKGHDMRRAHKGMGENTLMAVGVLFLGLMLSTLGIDVGMYFNAQNQLQTVVNHSALAGASKLPLGESHAETRARTIADNNEVLGDVLTGSDLDIETTPLSVKVTGHAKYSPIIMKAFCNNSFFNPGEEQEGQGCSVMDVLASAKAVPAARDTMLVIDASGSMDSLGNNRPMRDVQQAANLFIDKVSAQATQASDRIGLVRFNRGGILEIGLTSRQQSPDYAAVKSKVNGITPFTGGGINTNYYAGLKYALDELETNGRPNAQKRIIFMTDGKPNLPGPPSHTSYNSSLPYTKCSDPVNSSVANNPSSPMCTYDSKKRRWTCPTLPSSKIPDSRINQTAVNCGNEYTSYMESMTKGQVDRAENLKVVIDTIEISDGASIDGTIHILRRLIKQPDWEPTQLAYMTEVTQGQVYEALNYDATRISAIYEEAAKQIRVKLTAQ
jgi:Flp pilus assembly protein TadG